jgi:hypothetical protein
MEIQTTDAGLQKISGRVCEELENFLSDPRSEILWLSHVKTCIIEKVRQEGLGTGFYRVLFKGVQQVEEIYLFVHDGEVSVIEICPCYTPN